LSNPIVSIIIPTFNAEHNIKNCLEYVSKQTYQNLDIIIIDNVSSDKTVEIANEYKCDVLIVRSTWSEAIQLGVKHSKGKYYFVLESSLELFPSLIGECVEIAENNPKIVGLIGPEYSKGEGFWASCMKLERLLNIGYELVEAPRFIRKAAYELVGGYDTLLEFGDDWDFFRRLRKIGKVSRVKNGWFHNEGRPTPYGMMLKKYRYGRTARKYFTRSVSGRDGIDFFIQFLPIRSNFISGARILHKAGISIVLGYILLKTVEAIATGAAIVVSALDESKGRDIRYGVTVRRK